MAVAAASLVLVTGGAVAQDNGGAGGRARVLVAPLQVDGSVKKDFGKKVSGSAEVATSQSLTRSHRAFNHWVYNLQV